MKKLILALCIITGLSCLTGCSDKETLGDQVNKMMQDKQDIMLSVDEKVSEINKLELTWEELDQLDNYEELRDTWEDNMNIVKFDKDSKNGVIFIDSYGNWTGNNTLLNVFKNKEFVKSYWKNNKFKSAVAQEAISMYSDINNESTGLLASVNSYFNLLPANSDGTSGLMNYLSRKEAMTLLLRVDTPVHMLEENTKYDELFGYTEYNKYASMVEDNCYFQTSNGSLNAYTYNTAMTRAEAIYMIVQRYFKEDYSSIKDLSTNMNDCKNGGNILNTNGIKEDYASELYNLEISILSENNEIDEKLYKAILVAYKRGIVSKDTRWSDGIKYGELLNMIIKAYESMYNDSTYPVNAKVGNNEGSKLYDKEVIVPEKDTTSVGGVEVGTIKPSVKELLVKYKDEINMPEDLIEELKTNSEDWNIEYIDVKLRVWYCEFLNVRTGPTTDYPIIKTLKQATEVHVVARCVDNGWCLVIADGYMGFQHGSYLANLDY